MRTQWQDPYRSTCDGRYGRSPSWRIFSTHKFVVHGGKMQKEIEQKKKQAEIDAAKSAKASTTAKSAPKKKIYESKTI